MKNKQLLLLIAAFLFLSLIVFLGKVDWTGRKPLPSIIVLAVENLGAQDLLCTFDDNSPGHSGVMQLCKESVRFSHAYTTSPLAVPAIASILTGKYPMDTNLHDNSQFLSAKEVSIAELAIDLGYATAFFSGAAPVLRKTGLHQGFEQFQDYFTPSTEKLFEPFGNNIKSFFQWGAKIKSPFLAFFYIPDLMFKNFETKDKFGQPRPKSFEGQKETFDFHLMELIESLKKQKKWDSTYIFLIGLNGKESRDFSAVPNPLNLHSEMVQIGLLIKPILRPRDEGLNWSEDQMVSIADVGVTLRDLIKSTQKVSESSEPLNGTHLNEKVESKSLLSPKSLMNIIKKPGGIPMSDRFIPIESGWSYWKFHMPIYLSVRTDHFLYLHEKSPKLFNTLTDKWETASISSEEVFRTEIYKKIYEELDPFLNVPFEVTRKIKDFALVLQYNLWMSPLFDGEKNNPIKYLLNVKDVDNDISPIVIFYLIKRKSWKELKAFGTKIRNYDVVALAERQLSKTIQISKMTEFINPCLNLLSQMDLVKKKIVTLSVNMFCQETDAMSLLQWLRFSSRGNLQGTEKITYEKAVHFLQDYFMMRKIVEYNLALGLIWDVPNLPTDYPTILDIAIELPYFEKEKEKLLKVNFIE